MATKKTNTKAPTSTTGATKVSHTDKIGPVMETEEIPPAQRGDSPYRKAVSELDVGQNRVFPKASRNCVVKYAKQAGYEYQCRTSADGETFTLYRTA